MALTLSHWIYLLVVLLVIAGMAMRRGVIPLCVLGTFAMGWVYTGSFLKAVQTLYKASLISAQVLLGIIIIIAIMIALLRLLEHIGADQLILRPFRNVFRGPGVAFWGTGLIKGVVSAFVWPTPATMRVMKTTTRGCESERCRQDTPRWCPRHSGSIPCVLWG
ncbi:hypothetical protein [Alicyclobacillus pomorum]|uniref:hypothetical protein n=1 Tax=Alicyclobacillus pomorum TaxID=204470 RepID=UPI00047DC5B4|nr:hypothetical protein [Alicyclobacillus pomorum]